MQLSVTERERLYAILEKYDQNPLFTIEKCTQKQYNASSRKTKQSGLKSRNIHFEKRGKRK